MGATTSVDDITYLKWNESNFTWDSVDANKTWDNMGYLTYHLVATETLVSSEKPIKTFGRTFNEPVLLADKKESSVTLNKKETLRATEKAFKRLSSLRKETITLTDKHSKTSVSVHLDSFSLKDNAPKKQSSVLKKENIGLSESYTDVMNFFLNVLEGINLNEVKINNTSRVLRDGLSVKDKGIKHASLRKQEGITVSELVNKRENKVFADILTLADDVDRDFTKVNNENLLINDKVNKNSLLSVKEAFSLVDEFRRKAIYLKKVLETLSIEDTKKLNAGKSLADYFSVTDREYREQGKNVSETIGLVDNFDRQAVMKRLFGELVLMTDIERKRVWSNQSEFISLLDRYIKASNAILSNIDIQDGEMTLQEFIDKSTQVSGYGVFADFNVGDYKYQHALVRIQINSNEANVSPLIYNVEHHVDIDDTDDKGLATITDTTQATKVYFNKHYYNPPEVNVTIKGGSGTTLIIPNVLSTSGEDETGRYFTVELRDTMNNRCVGTIAWVSKGY